MSDHDVLARLMPQTEDSAPFWRACNEGRFLLRHCQRCDHTFYYPRRLCPACGGDALDWRDASGRGRVFSFSEVHVPFMGDAWASQVPYTVVVVDLDEGPRMLSRLVGDDRADVAIGDALELCFVEADAQQLPFFRRAAA
jgi:uncharacterized protein